MSADEAHQAKRVANTRSEMRADRMQKKRERIALFRLSTSRERESNPYYQFGRLKFYH